LAALGRQDVVYVGEPLYHIRGYEALELPLQVLELTVGSDQQSFKLTTALALAKQKRPDA